MKKVNNRLEYLQEVSKLIPINPICIEIGVLDGNFSQQILDILKPKKLYLVDSWENGYDKNGAETYKDGLQTSYSSYEQYLTLKEKYSKDDKINVIRNFSYDAVGLFEDNYFDFIYIDACHLYECVKQDLLDYLPKLKENGLMCGHDYFINDYYGFGVIEAVNEFCEKNNYEMIIFNNEFGSDWALTKKLPKLKENGLALIGH